MLLAPQPCCGAQVNRQDHALQRSTHLVTMVRMGSSGPVGVMMNQKNMFTMFTSHIACDTSVRGMAAGLSITYAVQVEAIAKHEFPKTYGLHLVRSVGALHSQVELVRWKIVDERQLSCNRASTYCGSVKQSRR